MGIIQSIFCSISFCVERVLTWVCCAVVLISLLFTIVLLMIYGITVGYHYAQKELAAFAYNSRSTTEPSRRAANQPFDGGLDIPHYPQVRSGKGAIYPDHRKQLMRYKAVEENIESTTSIGLEMYRTKKPIGGGHVFWDAGETSDTPVLTVDELETEQLDFTTDLSLHEKDLARRLLGRVRRSRNNNTSRNVLLKRFRQYG